MGRALVLPQSPPCTSRDQFPLYYKAYKHVFGKLFCFKWRSRLNCCCNILDGATIRTSYNNRISYCLKHMTLPLLREEFTYTNNLLPQTMGAYHMHMLPTIVNHIVLIVAPSKMLQQSADAKFSLDLHSEQRKLHKNIFVSYFYFKPNYRKTSALTNRHAKSQHQACSRFGWDTATTFATRY